MKFCTTLIFLMCSFQIWAKQIDTIDTIDIDSMDELYLYENHIVISSYRCNGDGLYVTVYDRKSYKELKSIRLQGCDSEYQDNIVKVDYKNGKYYVLLYFRYGEGTRNKLAVIDSVSFQIEKTYTLNELQQSDYIPSDVDYSTGKKSTFHNTHIEMHRFKSDQYEVKEVANSDPVEISHKFNGDGKVKEIILISGKVAIFRTYRSKSYETIIYLVNIEENEQKEIFRLETAKLEGSSITRTNGHSNIAYYKDTLVIGVNRDLHIINTTTQEIKVLKEYHPANLLSHGLDTNAITRLMFDKKTERLLIFSHSGKNNSYLSLSEL